MEWGSPRDLKFGDGPRAAAREPETGRKVSGGGEAGGARPGEGTLVPTAGKAGCSGARQPRRGSALRPRLVVAHHLRLLEEGPELQQLLGLVVVDHHQPGEPALLILNPVHVEDTPRAVGDADAQRV